MAFVLALATIVCTALLQAADLCPGGELWEPYSETCAGVRDVRADFLPPAVEKSISYHSDAPVPGTMSAGTAYASGELIALESGRLHTRMFVHPDGLDHQDPLPTWLYTTATSRVDHGLEVVGMYTETQDAGILGLYAWTCLPDYPCPNGSSSESWQWSRPMPELTCNITQIVDQGGHAQKQLYYANHSDRLDDGAPPLWKSAVYLWNYCDKAWDLAWEHLYRADKIDCSVAGSGCAWWGPSFEIFGDAMYPEIGELGYEDSLLYHDGAWSRLLPPEADFRDPADPRWGALTPWQLFHLEPNRSYGVGNWVNDNHAPVIAAQAPLWTLQGESLLIDTGHLTISDPDVDPAYHVEFRVTIYGGDNYTYTDNELTPDPGFTGELVVPVTVSDSAAESNTFQLRVGVLADNEAPVIQGQQPLSVPENQAITIGLGDLVIVYPGGDPSTLGIQLYAGANYAFSGTTVTPAVDYTGELQVPVTVSDGQAVSEKYSLLITVVPVDDDTVPPQLTLLGAASVTVPTGNTYVDAGATAIDNVDGNITDRIVVDNPVDTSRAGTYIVTYTVTDLAGNTATATRSVIVQAVAPAPSGGGGVMSVWLLVLLMAGRSVAGRRSRI